MAAPGAPRPTPSSSQRDGAAAGAEPALWSLPGALPETAAPPADTAHSSRVIEVGQHSHQELLELAAAHNRQQGLPPCAFDAILRGIPERAQLRPNSVEATTYTLGLKGLPPSSRQAKAWRKVLRSTRTAGGQHQHAPQQQPAGLAAAKAGGAGLAATEAGGGPKRQPKPAAATAADRLALWQKLQPANLLTAEQRAFRSALAAFLGRPVNVPLLAVGAPVLDLQQLLKEVTTRGKADWQLIAAYVQRDTSLAALVAAVYECFLQPLEDHMPYGYRPARALDLMLGETQQRAAMGAGVVGYEAVVHSAEQAATALERLAAAPQQRTAQAASQQQQQSSHAGSGSGSGVAGTPSQQPHQQQGSTPPPGSEQQQQAAGSLLAAQHGLLLLQHAALQPELLVEQLLQQGLQEGLHQPSKAACIAWRKQILATRHKTNRSDLELFFSKEAKASAAAAAAGAGPGPEAKAGAATAPPAPAASGSVRGRGRGRGRSRGRGRGGGRVQAAAAAEEPQQDDAGITAISRADVDAARWLLLSRRAALGGPPGCRQPLLRLPGMEAQPKGGGKPKAGGSGKGSGSRAGGRAAAAAVAPPTAAGVAAAAGGRSKRKR